MFKPGLKLHIRRESGRESRRKPVTKIQRTCPASLRPDRWPLSFAFGGGNNWNMRPKILYLLVFKGNWADI